MSCPHCAPRPGNCPHCGFTPRSSPYGRGSLGSHCPNCGLPQEPSLNGKPQQFDVSEAAVTQSTEHEHDRRHR